MSEEESKYHIGTRLYGYTKEYAQALQGILAKRLGLGDYNTERTPPHVTFIRPFRTNNETRVKEAFEQSLQEIKEPIIYEVQGFNYFDNKTPVLYLEIARNGQIQEMIGGLEQVLEPHIEYLHPKVSLPGEERINLHVSVLAKKTEGLKEEIQQATTEYPFWPVRQALLRVYLLKDKRILREFDLTRGENLDRETAKNPFELKRSKNRFELETNWEISSNGLVLPVPH